MHLVIVRGLVLLLAALLGSGVADAAGIPVDCSSGPVYVTELGVNPPSGFATADAACNAVTAAATGWGATDGGRVGALCSYTYGDGYWYTFPVWDACAPVGGGSGGGTVALVLPEVTQEHYDAVNAIFAAVLGALCVVGGLAAVARFFNRSPDA
jgi:hypothetical protein